MEHRVSELRDKRGRVRARDDKKKPEEIATSHSGRECEHENLQTAGPNASFDATVANNPSPLHLKLAKPFHAVVWNQCAAKRDGNGNDAQVWSGSGPCIIRTEILV